MIKLFFFLTISLLPSVALAALSGNDLIDRCRALEHQLALIRYDLTIKKESVRLLREYGLANNEFRSLLCPITSVTRNSVVFGDVNITAK